MEVNCACETRGEYQREYYIEMVAVSIFVFSTMILLWNSNAHLRVDITTDSLITMI